MAELVLALATSHSPILGSVAEDFTLHGERDKNNPRHLDKEGRPCGYDDLLAAAGGAFSALIATSSALVAVLEIGVLVGGMFGVLVAVLVGMSLLVDVFNAASLWTVCNPVFNSVFNSVLGHVSELLRAIQLGWPSRARRFRVLLMIFAVITLTMSAIGWFLVQFE